MGQIHSIHVVMIMSQKTVSLVGLI